MSFKNSDCRKQGSYKITKTKLQQNAGILISQTTMVWFTINATNGAVN